MSLQCAASARAIYAVYDWLPKEICRVGIQSYFLMPKEDTCKREITNSGIIVLEYIQSIDYLPLQFFAAT